jgi:hypothetical protein
VTARVLGIPSTRKPMLFPHLQVLKDEVDRRAKVIGAPPSALPTYGSSADMARPHIEVHGPHYHYVIVERRREYARRVFTTLDDLLFHVFRSVALSMAAGWEVAHRVPEQDSRRGLFGKQIELLERLDPTWAERARQWQQEVLARHPFDDELAARHARLHPYRRRTQPYRQRGGTWEPLHVPSACPACGSRLRLGRGAELTVRPGRRARWLAASAMALGTASAVVVATGTDAGWLAAGGIFVAGLSAALLALLGTDPSRQAWRTRCRACHWSADIECQ